MEKIFHTRVLELGNESTNKLDVFVSNSLGIDGAPDYFEIRDLSRSVHGYSPTIGQIMFQGNNSELEGVNNEALLGIVLYRLRYLDKKKIKGGNLKTAKNYLEKTLEALSQTQPIN